MIRKNLDLAVMILCVSSTAAWAHPGHGVEGFLPGVLHPLYGADHLITALAVGVWATLPGKKAIFAFPLTFILAMVLGAFAGFEGYGLPFKESGILISMALLGCALVFSVRPPLFLSLPILASFGIFHGNAHGVEMLAGFSTVKYALGFTLATAFLHLAGMASVGLLQNLISERTAQFGVRVFGTFTLASAVFVGFA